MPQSNQANTFSAPLHHGTPPLSALLDEYLSRAETTLAPEALTLEQEAFQIMTVLSGKKRRPARQDKQQLAGDLQPLADKGSLLATYVFAVQLRAGTLLARDTERGTQLLFDLCDKDFAPAFAELVQDVSALGLLHGKHAQYRAMLVRGCDLGIPACLLFMGQAMSQTAMVPVDFDSGKALSQLLDLARTGCWEALKTAVEYFLSCEPNPDEAEIRGQAIDLLKQACEADWTEAMLLYSRVLSEGTLLEQDTDQVQIWCGRACDLGNLEGCARGGLLLVLQGKAQTGKAMLARGCERKHALCLANMGLALLVDDREANWEKARGLLAEAAALGELAPYVQFLWEQLLVAGSSGDAEQSRPDTQQGTQENSARFALDELVRLSKLSSRKANVAAGALLARYKVALVRARLASSPVYAALAREGISGEPVEKGVQLLRQCHKAGCGPAAGTLAEAAFFTPELDRRDIGLAANLAEHGAVLHDPRSLALEALIALDEAEGQSLLDQYTALSDNLSTLVWCTRKSDLLAQSILCCLATGTGTNYCCENIPLPGYQTRDLLFFARQLRDVLVCCITKGDTAPVLYLARQFQRGKKTGRGDTLARTLDSVLGLFSGSANAGKMSGWLLGVANHFGAAHTGQFPPLPISQVDESVRQADRKKEKARQARKAAKKARKRR